LRLSLPAILCLPITLGILILHPLGGKKPIASVPFPPILTVPLEPIKTNLERSSVLKFVVVNHVAPIAG